MATIRIQETQAEADGKFGANVSFDGEGVLVRISLRPPYTGADEEKEFNWYFEQHVGQPFVGTKRAELIAGRLKAYGEGLFREVFSDPKAYSKYSQRIGASIAQLSIEVQGSSRFQAIHWELLRDPDLMQPLGLDATIVRRNIHSQGNTSHLPHTATFNLLVVTARPHGARDVSYRTISRPLFEALHQSGARVHVDFVRPGTWQALQDHLTRSRTIHPGGWYHAIHFDLHGGVLSHESFDPEPGFPCLARSAGLPLL